MTTLFLHTCCADCLLRYLVASSYSLPPACHQFLVDYQPSISPNSIWSDLTLKLYFFNPNIYPQSEYNSRLKALQQIARLLQLELIVADYQPQEYFNLPACQTQLQTFTSSSARCYQCQTLRLTQTFQAFEAQLSLQEVSTSKTYVSSTMLASQYLDQSQIKIIGQNLTSQHIEFFIPTFTLKPATLRTTGFFKQNYCGCLFSLLEKSQNKYLN